MGHKSSKTKTQQEKVPDRRAFTKLYTLGDGVGEPGAFGHAYVCIRKSDRKKFAVKVIEHSDSIDLAELANEIKLLSEFDHPNIVKGVDHFQTETKRLPNGRVIPGQTQIVMELCTGSELLDAILDKGNLSEAEAAGYTKQILEGLAYMHDRKIAHCDLKPSNFLFSDEKHECIKIIDFGMSTVADRNHPIQVVTGTYQFMAPEVFEQNYSYHCDMWSMGAVLYAMLFGSFAFSATDPEPDIDHGPYSCTFDSGQSTREECRCDNCQIQTAICNGFDAGPARPGYGPWFPADIPVSSEAMDLIGRMLQSNPVTRITAREALAHPWLNGSAPTQPLVAGLFTNLGQIAAQSKLKKLLLECLSTDLFSALELKQISNAFEEIDSNGDGHITLEELNTVLARMAADGTPGASKTGEQVRNLMALGDIDNDGTLSFKELLAHASSRKLIAKEERLRSLFELIDEDGNGRITLEEIDKLTHGQIPRAELESMIAEVDRDNDQTLDYDEFVHVFVNAGNPLFDGILN